MSQLQIVSRADLYGEPDCANPVSTGDVERLQLLLTETLRPLKHNRDEDASCSLPRMKRRKESTPEQTVLFRLVSSSLPPLPVSLLPPPPSFMSRAPEAEDNGAQALLRKQRSEIVAVDGTSILLGANPTNTQKSGDVNLQARLQIPTPAPPMLVIAKQQRPRKTRPPVSPSELVFHPYITQGPQNPAALSNATICPVIDMDSNEPQTKSSRRQRRKRLEESTRQRPSPRFWRPKPSWSGPCRGYAFGYPSSLGGAVDKEYERDRMKKAICER